VQDAQQAPNGLHIHGKAVDVSATDHAVDMFVSGWEFTLNWISHNPLPFIAVLVFLGWLVISGRQTRIKMREMKLEYDAKRSSVRGPSGAKTPARRTGKGGAP
jgi:hypothetical protein